MIALAGAHVAPAAAQPPMASGMWLPDPGDGSWIIVLGEPIVVRPGRWLGAQPGLFAQSPAGTPALTATRIRHADFDGFAVRWRQAASSGDASPV